jgi:ferrochelatase
MENGYWSARAAPYAVLLVAYGGPRSLDEVEPYLNDVRGGRTTAPEVVEELRQRYAAIGGSSPLLDRTQAQARALASALENDIPVYVGMRHWHPYIADVLGQIRAAGHQRVVAIALAPHFSRMSIGAYQHAIDAAHDGISVNLVRQWHDHPGFLDAVAARVREALDRFPEAEQGSVALIFTAHSLPRRILAEGDPYPDQLQASVDGVLRRIGRSEAIVAFQSAGRTAEPWLGPDAGEVLRDLAARGTHNVLLCPIGFVSDHLEVLYDVDIELQALAAELHLTLRRTESLNDCPPFITALSRLAQETAGAAGWA